MKRQNSTINSIKYSIYIVIFDLDNFKAVNDNLGHLVGDKLLVSLSDILKKFFSKANVLCRWGGDEFALIYYGDVVSLELIVTYIKAMYGEITSKYNVNSNISFGGLKWTADIDVEKVVSRADVLLYESKRKGRWHITIKEVPTYECMTLDEDVIR